MKRIWIMLLTSMLLMITGCADVSDVSASDSKYERNLTIPGESPKEEPEESEEKILYQTVAENEVDTQSEIVVKEQESEKKSETTTVAEKKEEQVVAKEPEKEIAVTEESKETVPPKETPKQEEIKTSEPETPKETVKETEPVKTESKEPQREEVPKEEKPKEEKVDNFDVQYWIGFAKSYAAGRGLSLDGTATDCWDNPITANANCRYLERDIKDRIDYYVDVEGFESVWVWYEQTGENTYLIYIGYA